MEEKSVETAVHTRTSLSIGDRKLEYIDFLKSKRISVDPSGFEPTESNPKLFDWQNDIVRWALVKGRACIFADCGLGKTAMQLQWALQVAKHTNMPVLILAPLAVAQQTKREGEKFGVHVNVCRTHQDVSEGVNITNYEMVTHFDAEKFSGIVLDESSILKDYSSKTRQFLTEIFHDTPYKLCCTATPAPNDYKELGTHAQFCNVMTQTEMLSTFFCHDGGNTSQWRLKGHAERKFFEWVAGWACCLTSPKDLGYNGDQFILPELRIHEITTHSDDLVDSDGQMMLLAKATQDLQERRQARRSSLEARVNAASEIANGTDDQVLVWCDLNDESAALADRIHGAVEVRGNQSPEYKESALSGFSSGKNRALISKPSIAGWGMNWQQCSKMIFVGLSDSFESYYQAVRRCWRFGQEKPVDVYIVTSDAEGCVKDNIERKQRDAERMTSELVRFTKDILSADLHHTVRMSEEYRAFERMEIPEWLLTESA